MAERLYTIEEESPFHIQLKLIENIEDAGDVFYTEDELKETMGLSSISTYGPMVKRDKIVGKLNEMKQSIIKKGKKTTLFDDPELVEFFQTHQNYAVSDFVKGLRRVGNRLFIHEKTERTEFKKKDVQALISACVNYVNSTVKCTFELKYVYEDYVGALKLLQKLVTLEEVMEWINGNDRFNNYVGSKRFFKEIWENPEKIVDLK